jgi:hypothetical protein
VEVKFNLEQTRKAQRVIRCTCIVLLFNLGEGWECVVNVTPRPLYPQESPGTHCKGGCVEASYGLDGCEKSRLQRYLTFGPSSP